MDKLNVKIRDGQLVTEENVKAEKKQEDVYTRLTGRLLPFQIQLIQKRNKELNTYLDTLSLELELEQEFNNKLENEEKILHQRKLGRITEIRIRQQEEAEQIKAVQNELRDVSIKAFDRITDATADLLDGTTKNFDGIRSAMSMFLKDLQRTILQLTLFNDIKNRIFGTNLPTASGGEIFDNIIGLFSGIGGGGTFGSPDSFAKGGRVQRGRPYLVGERGAEMFVPNTGGTIMNNMNTRGIGGGSTVVNQTINVDAGVSQTVRAEIINLLPVIKQDTISSLLEAKRRGGSFATALA